MVLRTVAELTCKHPNSEINFEDTGAPSAKYCSTMIFKMTSERLNAVVMPNMTSKLTVRVTQTGEIQLICNEYCGMGHHIMKATIIVE